MQKIVHEIAKKSAHYLKGAFMKKCTDRHRCAISFYRLPLHLIMIKRKEKLLVLVEASRPHLSIKPTPLDLTSNSKEQTNI